MGIHFRLELNFLSLVHVLSMVFRLCLSASKIDQLFLSVFRS